MVMNEEWTGRTTLAKRRYEAEQKTWAKDVYESVAAVTRINRTQDIMRIYKCTHTHIMPCARLILISRDGSSGVPHAMGIFQEAICLFISPCLSLDASISYNTICVHSDNSRHPN